MKEFEKWDDSLPTLEKRYQSLERKKGWKAALEWVLDQETGAYGSLISLLYKIDEELEEED